MVAVQVRFIEPTFGVADLHFSHLVGRIVRQYPFLRQSPISGGIIHPIVGRHQLRPKLGTTIPRAHRQPWCSHGL